MADVVEESSDRMDADEGISFDLRPYIEEVLRLCQQNGEAKQDGANGEQEVGRG